MKRYTQGLFWVVSIAVLGVANAQEVGESPKKEKSTYMERFEPELVKSAEERLALKQTRLAELEHSLSIIDTLDISERRRRALRKDLETRPFSHRLYRTLTEIQFGEDLEE